ncbi:putative Cyclase [Hyella patelloides LEGE 07179]|uniref:Putative Cyclase n=2 Tax=Hyella TaxID=945733 RepID=A0A563W113_9CYAN|nr:putative Cyclase [Hyella patelloides LEGE 07179]
MLMLLAVSISSIIAIAYIGYSSGQQALSQSIFNQLTSLRESKAYQIETYFKNLRSQVQTISEMPSIPNTMREFQEAYQELKQQPVNPEWNNKLKTYYEQEFLPRLAKNVKGTPLLFSYLPKSNTARYLQYHYIANNSNPVGQKQFLQDPMDGSKYSEINQRIQSVYRDFVDEFGYYDMFLIDIDTGDIVYSVDKEADFATNIYDGPYLTSGLASVVREIQKNPSPGFVAVSDFEPYRASYAVPAAFIASPIFDDSGLIGVLAFQISVDEINTVMTGNQNWQRDGLGESGETYLVGEDRKMRSTSRFLIEDPKGYLQAITNYGLPQEEVEHIRQLGTTVFYQEIKTEAVEEALSGQTDTNIGEDYRGVTTLNAYSPLEINGLDWAIIAQINRSEALAPILQFGRRVLFSTSIIVLLVTAIAGFFSHQFVRPIRKLTKGFKQVGAGETDVKVQVKAKDEFRLMAHSFNEMVENLHHQQQLVKEREKENEKLLLSILPEPVANRLKEGEEDIADSFPNVTVLFADLSGFTELCDNLSANEIVAFLNELVIAFDEAAELYGVEKVKTIGSGYMAVSGLSVPRIDHNKRVVDFALEMIRILRSFNRDRNINLKIRIGVNSGEVVAGIIGRSKFIYDLWGDTVNIAHRLQVRGAEDMVQVTEDVYARLTDVYEFKSISDIEIPGKGTIPTWSVSLN